ncbi:uncharacterized protein FIBRA_00743 [Fibroporia radiculosa]|uniref:HCP-like protein n=1 Tax=Fibroporia radiculosa TaxID=599839 RepID=J4G0K8_9APHY|nr:uncharacterized protein FIBRA_00743 [Fibroporia radiculosa]CCL98738.1 predicted protein [Fibroporia radiculosa]
MAAPPVPPRPFNAYDDYLDHYSRSSPGPPIPPLPPGFTPADAAVSPPHFEDPLVAPRPHKLQPDLPANMARNLDDQMSQEAYHRGRSPAPHLNPSPGFAMPHRPHSRGPPVPPQQGPDWTPWAPVQPHQAGRMPHIQQYPPQPNPAYPSQNGHYPRHNNSLNSSFSNSSISDHARPMRTASVYSTHGPQMPPPQQPANTSAPPSLTAPLPTIPTLLSQLPSVEQPHFDPAFKIAWCRDVLALVDRAQQLAISDSSATEFPTGPARIDDPELQRLVDIALPLLAQVSSLQETPKPPFVSEAIYLVATCEASGAYPQYIQRDPRSAFRHFEQSAKAGHYAAWFRLGRDYENFNDAEHAKQCFERGVKRGVESCIYRMGMANLMGQLGLPANAEAALPLLHRAATIATTECPQPAYVYGLLLLNEFSHVSIPLPLFQPFIPPGSNAQMEARKNLERAAYLNFAPAQYKLGHAYEFALPPFPFDALLSVQYYSLASQQGEVEADMALSKWFLCGAEGAFERDEALAWTFAEKAARKGLPSAEFAMGYYGEVGVGGPKDIESATKWYTRAAQHGNTDAAERIRALSQPSPHALSREQHETLADTTIVRKRTLARQRSDARRGVAGAGRGGAPAAAGAMQSEQIVSNVRALNVRSPGAQDQAQMNSGYGGAPAPSPTVGQFPQNGGALQAPVRPFANAPRYSLVDPGSRPSSPGARQPASPAPSQGRRQGTNGSAVPYDGEMSSEPVAPQTPKPRGPQTFEEMGIVPAKLEEKECIIM